MMKPNDEITETELQALLPMYKIKGAAEWQLFFVTSQRIGYLLLNSLSNLI